MKTKTVILTTLLALSCLLMTSCRHGRMGKSGETGSQGEQGETGPQGQNGLDGINGIDGSNGLNGIGFDYVRGVTGAELCTNFLVIPANLVLPEPILNFAPPIDWHDIQGATLTFGDVALAFRYYLMPMMAGEYCVVEKVHGEGYVPLGQVLLTESGWLAVVPLGTLQILALDPGVFDQGILVTLEPEDQEEGCVTLSFDRNHLHFGKNIRINFNRD